MISLVIYPGMSQARCGGAPRLRGHHDDVPLEPVVIEGRAIARAVLHTVQQAAAS